MARCKVLGLLPDEFWAHRRTARRERLLSWRSLLDAAIEQLNETPAGTGEAGGPAGPRSQIFIAFREHRRAARREDLLALRSLVDAFFVCLKEPSPAEQATRIDIA